MSDITAEQLESAKQSIVGVIAALFEIRQSSGCGHPRTVGFASDSPAAQGVAMHEIQLAQRVNAGVHMCLAVAAAALEVAGDLLDDSNNLMANDRERVLQSCAKDVKFAGEAAFRAARILSDARA
ncbi:MAG: hypothetical protein ABJA77_16015 [Variovorax sp.]